MYLFCCLDSTQDGSGGALDDATDQEAIYVQIKKFQVCIILFQCFFVCDMGESNICQYFVFPVHHICRLLNLYISSVFTILPVTDGEVLQIVSKYL